jgi:6-phosphogluconolactonase
MGITRRSVITGTSATLAGALTTAAGAGPRHLTLHPTAGYAYLANRGADTVAVFAVADDGSALELVAERACGGTWPRHLALAPGGA